MPAPTAALLLRAWESAAWQPSWCRGAMLLATLDDSGSSGVEEHARLPLGQRDAALREVREALFGPDVQALTECPGCGGTVQLDFSLSQLRTESQPTPPEAVHTVESNGIAIEFRLLDSHDLADLAGSDVEEARLRLIERSVTRAVDRYGASIDPQSLPASVIDSLSEAMAAADPEADPEIAVECPTCGHRWESGFDISRFFWREVEALAHQLLREVHTLASGYGWSEAEILALTPERRQTYLAQLLA